MIPPSSVEGHLRSAPKVRVKGGNKERVSSIILEAKGKEGCESKDRESFLLVLFNILDSKLVAIYGAWFRKLTRAHLS